MMILSQVLLGFAAIALLIFSVRLIFTLLLRLQLLPVLIWLCVGRVYPQWAGSTPICVLWGAVSVRPACAVLLAASAGRMVAGDAEGSIGRTVDFG